MLDRSKEMNCDSGGGITIYADAHFLRDIRIATVLQFSIAEEDDAMCGEIDFERHHIR